MGRRSRRLAQCSHKPRNVRNHQKPEEAGKNPSLGTRRGSGLADTLIRDFGLQIRGRINSCCFKPLSWSKFVTTVPETSMTLRLVSPLNATGSPMWPASYTSLLTKV